ncbi:MAG TPA: ABC transporter permease [Acidimicrobiales bacterium]|nr:ABC transporter permease [Acidimicrobiales bacterium]
MSAVTTGRSAATAVYSTLLRGLATKGRMVALGMLALLAVALAVVVRARPGIDHADAAYNLVDNYGVSVLVPIVSLVFASAALGDPSEDGTLVYLWLRPVARWQLALAAAGAALTITLPFTVLPVVLAALISGVGGRLVLGALAGSLLAAVAYTAIFCGLGLRVRRALAWGLAYVVIWEQAVARVAKGAARVSISVSTRTVTARIAQHTPLPRNAMSMPVAVLVPTVATVLALVFTTRSLQRGEVA